jgi:hypothetical protein
MLAQYVSVKARAWAVAAAAAFLLAGASGAVAAQTAIDVPPQSFDHAQAGSKPIVKWRPDAASLDRERSDGPSFRVNVPLGAGAEAPMIVRLRSPAAQATDADDTDASADLDDDFIRDAEDQEDNFARNATER